MNAATIAQAGPTTAGQDTEAWDVTYDVVVAGFGYSGAMAAIAAADAGASVLLLEKQRNPGGNSILSGGSCAYGTDLDDTLAYLRHTCDGATDDEVVEALAKGMVDLPELVQPLAQAVGMEIVNEERKGAYPFPGSDQLRSLRITRGDSYKSFEWVTGERAGATLFRVLYDNVAQRDGIDISYETPVRRLIATDGEVVGCEIERAGAEQRVRARRAVVLCTGGFEHNPRLIRHFQSTADIGIVSPLGNTGDGILMGQKVGAALWHMAHVHGSYGFKLPNLPVAVRHSLAGARSEEQPMPWIIIDGDGKRFMNEYPPAPQDTPIRDLLVFDTDRQRFPRVPSFLLLDQRGIDSGPIGRPAMNDTDLQYEWSQDNSREIADGHIRVAETLDDLAAVTGAPAAALRETIDGWNAACGFGDEQFRRPTWSMQELDGPPFYVIPVHPVITNTQGGLVHDASQRVLDPFGDPIPRLFKAGENGSVFGHLYLLGGNNTECLVGGRIAGESAAQMAPTP